MPLSLVILFLLLAVAVGYCGSNAIPVPKDPPVPCEILLENREERETSRSGRLYPHVDRSFGRPEPRAIL